MVRRVSQPELPVPVCLLGIMERVKWYCKSGVELNRIRLESSLAQAGLSSCM